MIYIEESKSLNNFLNNLDLLVQIDNDYELLIVLKNDFSLFSKNQKKNIKHEFYNIYCSLLIDSNSYLKKLESDLIFKRNNLTLVRHQFVIKNINFIINILRFLNHKYCPRFIKSFYLYDFKKNIIKKIKNKIYHNYV